MKRSEVTYDAIILDKESVDKLTSLASSYIEGLVKRSAIHMTLMHYGKKTDEEKAAVQLNNIELGKNVEIKISALGIYRQNGIIMNVGAKVDEPSLSKTNLGYNRTLSKIFGMTIPHVTIAINEAAGAQSVNTYKCFGKKLEEGDTFEIIPLDSLITLKGKSTAIQSIKEEINGIKIKREEKAEELEDLPRDPQRNQSTMTIEEIVEALKFYNKEGKEIVEFTPEIGPEK